MGSAALALLIREGTPDRVVESLRSHAPHARLVKTSLSHVDEDKLRELIKTSAQQAEALRLASLQPFDLPWMQWKGSPIAWLPEIGSIDQSDD